MDIKVFIPGTIFRLQSKKVISLIWKKEKNISLVRKMKKKKIKKNRMNDFKFVDNMENINNHHPRAHFINNNNGSLVFTLWKWGETVALPVYSLFVRVATSGTQNNSVASSSGSNLCSNAEDSGITPNLLQHGIVRIILVTSPD